MRSARPSLRRRSPSRRPDGSGLRASIRRATLTCMTIDAHPARLVENSTMQRSLDITATTSDEFVVGVAVRAAAPWCWQWTWFTAGATRTW